MGGGAVPEDHDGCRDRQPIGGEDPQGPPPEVGTEPGDARLIEVGGGEGTVEEEARDQEEDGHADVQMVEVGADVLPVPGGHDGHVVHDHGDGGHGPQAVETGEVGSFPPDGGAPGGGDWVRSPAAPGCHLK